MLLRGITICVDYDDILQLTYPYNRHHFSEFLVVTSPQDQRTQEVCQALGVSYFVTDAFYRDGANFNKWLALEEGLTYFGRRDWMAIIDADIFWATSVEHNYQIGNIYTPARYSLEDPTATLVRESEWDKLPLLIEAGCPGWTQIFHAEDSHLGQPPWFQTDWRHCGGADSFFHEQWPPANNIRTSWRCLHLGPTWTNWCGRVAARRDGHPIPLAMQRYRQLREMLASRRYSRSYSAEKL